MREPLFSHRVRFFLFAVVVLSCSADRLRAANPFTDKVVPFLNAYCVRCHDAIKKSGELNLTRLQTASILEEFRQWEHVVTFVKKGEMPPSSAKQPTAAARAELVETLEKVMQTEARKLDGDPGVVPPRRLSNSEYDNTIRDLIGYDIQPAKEFPVDPASGEGFNNTGEALIVSPSLFKKYLAAAEQVAEHAVLTTQGLRFAPHSVVTFADRQKFYEQAIIRFYDSHAVNHEKLFASLWRYKHRPAEQKSSSVEQWAERSGHSAKYARMLWDALETDKADQFYLSWLRSRWNSLPKPADSGPATIEPINAIRGLVADLQRLSLELCPTETPAIVANAGNGPIEHLDRRRRTASTRDTFDRSAMNRRTLTLDYRTVTEKPTFKIMLDLAGISTTKAEGYAIVKAEFTTKGATNDGKKKWSLREVLTQTNPDLAAKLQFGKNTTLAKSEPIDKDSFVITAPGKIELDIPVEFFGLKGKGSLTLQADCRLDPNAGGLAVIRLSDESNQRPGLPMIGSAHPLAAKYEESAKAFCRLFPNRFYYVDSTRGLSAGFHLIEGFFRDDQPLCRWVLSNEENHELNRLWDEMYFTTGIWEKMLRGFVFFERSERNFMKHADFDPFKEEDPELIKDETLARLYEVYLRRSRVTLTGPELAKHPISVFFNDIRRGLKDHAANLKRVESVYRDDLLALAPKVYRRPLTVAEKERLEKFYTDVSRDPSQGIELAVRSSVTRLLVSPHFTMRFAPTPPGEGIARLSDLEVASRLSYFIWAGPPDEELLRVARENRLSDAATLRSQVLRMTRDPKVSRFAQEFFGQWLGYRDFPFQESVNRTAFPAFDEPLKQAMFEEPTRLIAHLIHEDRPITQLLNGDSTFVNRKLAMHYGLPYTGDADEWRMVGGLREKGRGGILGMSVFLTRHSQPQRTSPVKRGFWVVHKVLGEHIPPPPPDVAVLPAKETDTKGKTIRELLKLHVEDVKCARCHQRFDPVGLAMEGFDPIGRRRLKDLAGRTVDDLVLLPDGSEARGVPAFADYLVKHRKEDFLRTLCQKFLGYALGRSLQLSDQPLLERMLAELKVNDDRLGTLFVLVASSSQFRNQRCKDFTPSKFKADLSSEGKR